MKAFPFIAFFHAFAILQVDGFLALTGDRCNLLACGASSSEEISVESFAHNGWNLSYQQKPAAAGFEGDNLILLVHPVGIGLSSWFWNRLMHAWKGPKLVAVDLIGCGIQHGADAWDPDERGLSVPLGWVQCCEALMQQVNTQEAYSVVVQGGLAPVGVLLASRNPLTVEKLVLTSPPSWEDMTSGVPEKELAKNYDFFRSPVFGRLAFRVLESRWAVQFFSNLFLFADSCDETWLDEVENEACEEARPPVQVFNSGFCLHRSYEEELTSLDQPVLVVQGKEDKTRIPKRTDYSGAMKNCIVATIQGKNVVPWEFPRESAQCILQFLQSP